ncbi:(d)CMP kinase [Rhodospirillales bacterium YIM 152171]|uniref:Cytidylate kinase n=1 Tax=Marinimicrococcus flavescens TaxID=3031815 RepID=A0AAP4D7G6_9PROT|nr:(d)CMP kinase [Marinimicrococcus flavescens]
MSGPLVIAVDGPAASGKSTVARRLAAHFGLAFLDTGLLYRAVARRMIDRHLDPGDALAAAGEAEALVPEDVDERRLRGEGVGQGASKVAVVPAVRAALLPFQRRIATSGRGAVLAGRDVGTVICPDATCKLYVTASVAERARRRFEELRGRGEAPIYERVLEELIERDRRDQARSVAPLRIADDALTLDTTRLDADASFAEAVRLVSGQLSGHVDAAGRPQAQPRTD